MTQSDASVQQESGQAVDIRHDAASGRFTTSVDGHIGYVEYEQADGVMTVTHTVVPKAIGRRGIAAQLVEAALAYAREQGWKVAPRCSYADAFMSKRPEYADLRA